MPVPILPPDALARLKARVRELRIATEATQGACPMPHWFEAVEMLPDTDPLERCAVEWRAVVVAMMEEAARET